MKKIKKIAAVSIAGLAVIATGGLGSPIAQAANGVQPVTFEVGAGSLTFAQGPDAAAVALSAGVPVNLAVTTITDGRNNTGRSGAWTVTATASDLVAGAATIDAADITLAQTGVWTGSGGVVATANLVLTASANAIDSVYTYTPTATLAAQTSPNSGSYTGTVTQTIV